MMQWYKCWIEYERALLLPIDQVFEKNSYLAPNWLKRYMPTTPQSTTVGLLCSISVEGLNHVTPKWRTGLLT